jgi:hypothetical protein
MGKETRHETVLGSERRMKGRESRNLISISSSKTLLRQLAAKVDP